MWHLLFKPFTALLLLSLTTLPSTAEVYRVTDQDGNVEFTDQPTPAAPADNVQAVEIDDANSSLSPEAIEENQSEWLKKALEEREKKAQAEGQAAQNETPKDELDAWKAELKAAKQALKEAKKAQKEGITASEGDFIGKAGGGVRPSEQYFKKLEALDQNVLDAKERLKQIKKSRPK